MGNAFIVEAGQENSQDVNAGLKPLATPLMTFFGIRNGSGELPKRNACQSTDLLERAGANAMVIARDRCKRRSKGFSVHSSTTTSITIPPESQLAKVEIYARIALPNKLFAEFQWVQHLLMCNRCFLYERTVPMIWIRKLCFGSNQLN